MTRPTAAQQRLFDNATVIAATHLIFGKLAEHPILKKLSDVVTIFNGQSLKKSERQDDGIFDVYGSGGLVGKYSKFLSEKSFVVIGRKGSAGKPTYAPFGGWVIDTAYYAQPNNVETLDTKFLYYALSSMDFSDDIISTAIPGINRTAIYKHLIPVPPMDVQIRVTEFIDAAKSKTALPILSKEFADVPRIVERIEALARRIREAMSLRDRAVEEGEAFWQSILQKAFRREGHGTQLNLEEICDAIIDNLHSTPKYDGNDYPCIRSQDIGWGSVNYSTALRVSSEEFLQRIARGEPKVGDIVFVREGDVGRCAIVDGSHRICLGQRVMMLRPNPKIVIPMFLMYQLISPPILREQLRESMTGTTSRHLNISKFRKVRFILPKLEEQQRIVVILEGLKSRMDALRRLQDESQKELEALLPSVLDKAFKGEL